MSLSLARTNALSGLSAAQEHLAILSQNISNSQVEGYSRQVANHITNIGGDLVQGVRIGEINRQVDDYLVSEIREQTSMVSQYDTLNIYHERIQQVLGSPGDGNSINDKIESFFTSLRNLSVNPELSSLKLEVGNRASELANKISTIARELEQYRFDADREVSNAVSIVNQTLTGIRDLNGAIKDATLRDQPLGPLSDKRDLELQKLAKYVNYTTFYLPNNEVSVSTGNGISLINETAYQLSYIPATSIDSFINNSPLLGSIKVQPLGENGENLGQPSILVSSGTGDSVTTDLTSGKIKGLLYMRDQLIPDMLEQLDTMAASLRDSFNDIHNDGTSFPPSTTLTGTNPLLANEEHQFSGTVTIAMLDDRGYPVSGGYRDGGVLPPLKLDLSSLDNGLGNNRPDIQTIIDEINNYFGPPQPRLSMGPLSNLNIASLSSSIGPYASFPTSSSFTFDLDLENQGSQNMTFEVLGVNVLDTGATGLTSTLPGSFTLEPGERMRTGSSNSITVDFNGVTSTGPYTIRLMVRATNQDGFSFMSQVDYQISDNTSNLMNDRITPHSVFSGDATIVAPTTNQRYLTASLVDKDGNPASAGEPGYLNITTNPNLEHVGFAINEGDSKELGQLENQDNYPATNRGFSHFFGLNNFFVEPAHNINNGQLNENKGAALDFKIRDDIVKDFSRISLGTLSELPQTTPEIHTYSIGTVKATGSILFNGNPQTGDNVNINGITYNFVAAAALPNEITVGPTLKDTLDNMSAVLNAANATTIGNTALATYSVTNLDTLSVSYDTAGIAGNAFTLAVNLTSSGVTASINGGTASQTNSATLKGGENGLVPIEFTGKTHVGIGNGANDIISALANLGNESLSFDTSGGLPGGHFTITAYTAQIVSHISTYAVTNSSSLEENKIIHKNLSDRANSISGVNVDEELANMQPLQSMYAASAQVIRVANQLFDTLLETFK